MQKYKLMDHQIYSLAMLEANEGLGLFLDMGLGKTMVCLAYAYKHLKRGDFRDGVLVICPASLVASWEQAIEDCIKFEGFDSQAVKLLKDNITIRSFQKTYKTVKVPVGKSGDQITYRRNISIRDDIDKH